MSRGPILTDEEILDAFRPYVDESGIARVRTQVIADNLGMSYSGLDGRLAKHERIVRIGYNVYRILDGPCERCGASKTKAEAVNFASEVYVQLCWACIKKTLAWIRGGVKNEGRHLDRS